MRNLVRSLVKYGKYGYKTGTFIITKKKFSNWLITLNIVYMYI